MKEIQNNGYVIQKNTQSYYRGIDGDNWYLNYCSNNTYFEEFYNNNIEKAWYNKDFVDCCIDNEYLKKYIEESLKLEIEFRILLCSTEKKNLYY